MVILTNSGNSAFRTDNIDNIGFDVRLDKNNKPIIRNGKVLVNKKIIHITFSSGCQCNLTATTDELGQQAFDELFKAMQQDESIKGV